MRLEWLPIVRNRNWREFEILAQENPTWLLYSTIQELAEGLPDRDDRFRLNQILKTLNAAGYGEEQEDVGIRRSPYEPLHPYRIAVMSEPNEFGDQLMTMMFARGDKVMTYSIYNRLGGEFYRAVAQQSRFKHVPFNRARARQHCPPDGFGPLREFPFEYVCHRAVETVNSKITHSNMTPDVQAGFKAVSKYAKSVPHPTDTFECPELSDDELRSHWRISPKTRDWLLFLNEEIPCMPEVAKTTVDLRSSVDHRAERRYEIFRENLDSFATDWYLADQVNRFKDEAFHLVEHNRWDEALPLVALARSIEMHGAESPVFDSMLRHTAKVIPGYLSDSVKSSVQSKIAA